MNLGTFLPYFHQGPHHFPSHLSSNANFPHAFRDFLWRRCWRCSQGLVCVDCKSPLTQPGASRGGLQAGLSEMLKPRLESSRTSSRETNKPSQLLEHCYLGNKSTTCKSTSSGPLEWGNYRREPWPDPFGVTAEFCSQLMSYCRKSYPSAKLQLISKNTQILWD